MPFDEIYDRIESIYVTLRDRDTRDPEAERRAIAEAEEATKTLALSLEDDTWSVRNATDYLGVSTHWLFERIGDGSIEAKTTNGRGPRFDYLTLRAYKESSNAKRGATLNELAKLGQEMGDVDEEPPAP